MSTATVSFVLKHYPDSTIQLGRYRYLYKKTAVAFFLKEDPDLLVPIIFHLILNITVPVSVGPLFLQLLKFDCLLEFVCFTAFSLSASFFAKIFVSTLKLVRQPSQLITRVD
jgi:hypothetical protein